MKLSYAVTPVHINQPFGANPDYYVKFHDDNGNPEKGHMGVDFMAAHGTPLYAPHDGSATYVIDSHGGDGIHLSFKEDGQWYKVILWHMCSKDDKQYPFSIPTDGSSVDVKRGQMLGYTDNSGAPFESSGDHLHFGLQPLQADGIRVMNVSNGFNGCIDPIPFFLADPTEAAIVTSAGAIITEVAALPKNQQKQYFGSLQKLLAAIKALFTPK